MGVCAIIRIPCACVACTSMLDKSWISGIPSDEQDLSSIDVHVTQAHGIWIIAYIPITYFWIKTKMIMLTQPSCAMRFGMWNRK